MTSSAVNSERSYADRSDRVVVAGADMGIAAQRALLATQHEAYLGVRLQFDEAVDHLHAGPLQVARQAKVGFLVEARLQFDQRRDVLAGFRRLDQRGDDG